MGTALVFRIGMRALHRSAIAAVAVWIVWRLDDRIETAILDRCHWP